MYGPGWSDKTECQRSHEALLEGSAACIFWISCLLSTLKHRESADGRRTRLLQQGLDFRAALEFRSLDLLHDAFAAQALTPSRDTSAASAPFRRPFAGGSAPAEDRALLPTAAAQHPCRRISMHSREYVYTAPKGSPICRLPNYYGKEETWMMTRMMKDDDEDDVYEDNDDGDE